VCCYGQISLAGSASMQAAPTSGRSMMPAQRRMARIVSASRVSSSDEA
jgi:hypothetical protein